jgi:hypothetical protein
MTSDHIDLSRAVWRKSSCSGGNGGQCLEVALNLPGIVAIRDSKNRRGPTLILTPAQWRSLLTIARADQLDASL